MNSTELLNVARDELGDAERPYIWSDTTLYRYIDDAQNMFCRLTGGILDARSYSLAVRPGVVWYEYDPLILRLRSATRSDTGREIPVMPLAEARVNGVTFDSAAGIVRVVVSGMEKDALRLWPVPNETVTLNLSVFRLPLEPVTGADQTFEIDDQHHEHLLLWIKHRAYDKEDHETFDRNKSLEYAQRFRTYCESAKVERDRRRRNTGAVSYGGI